MGGGVVRWVDGGTEAWRCEGEATRAVPPSAPSAHRYTKNTFLSHTELSFPSHVSRMKAPPPDSFALGRKDRRRNECGAAYQTHSAQ